MNDLRHLGAAQEWIVVGALVLVACQSKIGDTGDLSSASSGGGPSSEAEASGQAICGDGRIEGAEECEGAIRCSVTCTKTERVVFVTSSRHEGAFGGLAGADAICQDLAAVQDLGGRFVAWLSDDQRGPLDRFVRSSVPYVLVDALDQGPLIVANSWDDLVDGNLNLSPAFDEQGFAIIGATDTWSNTSPGGAPIASYTSCGGWTQTRGAVGVVGDASASDSTWSHNNSTSCTQSFRLYCFEQ